MAGSQRERLNAINVFPVADGEIVHIGKERSEEKLIGKIVPMLPADISGERWAVGHAAASSRVDCIVSILKEEFGVDNIVTVEIGPTVGTHAGRAPGVYFL